MLHRMLHKRVTTENHSNSNRYDALDSLFKSITNNTLRMALALYDLIDESKGDGQKVNNCDLAKRVCLKIEQRNVEEKVGCCLQAKGFY